MFKGLSIDTLGDLSNGQVRAMVDKELARAVLDLDGADPEDDAPRKVVIQIELTKDGASEVVAKVKAQAKLPALESGTTTASIRRRAGLRELVFQDTNPDNPEQAGFDDVK